jgi:TBC1 domain family member 5
MTDAMALWDGIFACDPTFELAQWICVAMLVRIRSQRSCILSQGIRNHPHIDLVILADYSAQLAYLLRYPTPPDFSIQTTSYETLRPPHHILLLLRQALTLQMAPSVATGAAVVYENRNLLNIPVELPDPPSLSMKRRPPIGDRSRSSSSADNGTRRAEHARYQSSGSMGLPEMLARGLLDRGESLGINKTVMNAVSEIKVSVKRRVRLLVAYIVRSVTYQISHLRSFILTVSLQHFS